MAFVAPLIGAAIGGFAATAVGTAAIEIGLSIGCHVRGRALRARR